MDCGDTQQKSNGLINLMVYFGCKFMQKAAIYSKHIDYKSTNITNQ